MANWSDAFAGQGFSLPMGASPSDIVVGQDELGRPVRQTRLGHMYSEPMMQRVEPGPTRSFGQRLGDAAKTLGSGLLDGIVSGVTAPGRALAGEPVTMGDVMDTAGFAQLGGAAMPAPKGALRSGSVRNDGFRAYHGSPHDFDKFSLDKIGTGEGAQAYGHGLYFADVEDVARGYRDALAPGMGDGALRAAGISDGDLRSMRQFTQSAVDPDVALRDWLGWVGKKETPEIRAAFMQEWNGKNPGHMYEVKIKANPDDFLDWDKPLSEQPQKVRDAVARRVAEMLPGRNTDEWYGDMAARAFYPQSDLDGRQWLDIGPAADASRRLRDAGIPGIKYLDAGSRGAGNGSRNYVVFDDSMIEILRKYGLAGATVGGAGLLAAPGDAQAAEIQNYLGLLPK